MVHAIIKWSLHNRLLVILGTLVLIGVGIYAAINLNVEAYPDPTPPLIAIISQNLGASPEEMERLVGLPLETALNGTPGLQYLRSTSIAGLNDIRCQFSYGTDYWTARQEVLNRIATVKLPEGVHPELSPWSPTGEIVRLRPRGTRLYAEPDQGASRTGSSIGPSKQVPGVIDVVGFGGTIKQYQVLVDTGFSSSST